MVAKRHPSPLAAMRRELAKLQARSLKLADARGRLPAGSSRARVTTANARWARVAESRDRLAREIERLERAESEDQPRVCIACGETDERKLVDLEDDESPHIKRTIGGVRSLCRDTCLRTELGE